MQDYVFINITKNNQETHLIDNGEPASFARITAFGGPRQPLLLQKVSIDQHTQATAKGGVPCSRGKGLAITKRPSLSLRVNKCSKKTGCC